MNSFSKIQKDWDITDSFPVNQERILSAFEIVQKEIDRNWFEKRKKSGLGKTLIVLEAVRLAEAYSAAKKIGANELLKDLKLDWSSEDLQNALNESDVIVKLSPLSDNIDYEPRIDGISTKPDLLQQMGNEKVQYEIYSPSTSYKEKERTEKLTQLTNEISHIFTAGCLDIYILVLEIPTIIKEKLMKDVEQICHKTEAAERNIDDAVFIVYEPTGGVTEKESNGEKRWILETGKVIGGCLVDPDNDRSVFLKKKLGLRHRSRGLTAFSKSTKPNKFTNFKLIRLFWTTFDNRAFQKVMEECAQLSKNLPSIVVIVAGAGVSIEEWANCIFDAFKEGNYQYPSGVWLRELRWGHYVYEWREIMVINPNAKIQIPSVVIKSIFAYKGICKFEKYVLE